MIVPYFVIWKWRDSNYRTEYTAEHVNTAVWMMTKQGVPLDRIVLVTDDPQGAVCRTYPLWDDHRNLPNISGKQLPSCYRRLKIFDPSTLSSMGIPMGQRVVSIDLDMVILQKFLPLFQRKEQYVGWKVSGMKHRIVMNGSMFMWTAGEMDWLWNNFHPEKSPREAAAAGYMGSDQGYLSHQLVHLPFVGGWTNIEHGVLSYARDVIRGRLLPRTGTIVFFAGKLKPWMDQTRRQSDWILRYVPKPGELELAA